LGNTSIASAKPAAVASSNDIQRLDGRNIMKAGEVMEEDEVIDGLGSRVS
jgi:hypothetical protein